MPQWKSLADIRREYGNLSLNEDELPSSPFEQFALWYQDAVSIESNDPTAMVLSTVDEQGHPDSRVVLLKGIVHNAFVFFTNYQSQKAKEINHHPYAALNFYWPLKVRQVRIRGRVKKVHEEHSDSYFASRPRASQSSAIISPQSAVISSRTELEERFNAFLSEHQQESLMRPEYWGGYQVLPDEIEFWQGRDNRLHDRILYHQTEGTWTHCRLAP